MLGATQDEACRILRSVPVGAPCTIQVCRGYALVLDPTNKVRTADRFHLADASKHSPPPLQINAETIYAPATSHQTRNSETSQIAICKSSKGFGFTITDSPQGQRIKSILYPDQCRNLNEGDLILQVDGQNAQAMSHGQLVRILQELPIGYQTQIIVARQSPRHR